ncbi:MAG: hypothetical protein AVDCRST_MAG85-47, partial [uncultured Solirubrobacteraceae bacterium]
GSRARSRRARPVRRPRRDAPPQQRRLPALLRDGADRVPPRAAAVARPVRPRGRRVRRDLRRVPHQLPLAGALRRGARGAVHGRRGAPIGVPGRLRDESGRSARRGGLRVARQLRLRHAEAGRAARGLPRGARGGRGGL